MGEERSRQHRRRLLRDDTGAHRPHCARRFRPAAAQACEPAAPLPAVGPRGAQSRARNAVRQRRRTYERHRLGQVPQADRSGRLHRGARDRTRPGGERRTVDRHQHGRGHARFTGRDGAIPESRRVGARHRAGAGHDRFIQVVGDRGGPAMPAGQGCRQLDIAEGGRGSLSRACATRAALRCGGGRDGVRRERPGRQRGPQGGDLRARLPPADRARRIRSRGHHLRRQHLRRRDRHRGACRLRHRVHRGGAPHQGAVPGFEDQRRSQQRLIRIPRQRHGARGDACRVPLSRDSRGSRHGHRQCGPARNLRGNLAGTPRLLRGRDPEPPARRNRAPARNRGDVFAATVPHAAPRTSPGADGRSASGSNTP